MLSKIENAYLAILRVVILVAATIALVAAAFGLVAGSGRVLKWAGVTQTENPSGGTLGDFITEQKQMESETSQNTGGSVPAPSVLPDLAAAARNLQKYLGKRSDIPVSEWERVLQESADQMGDHSKDYAASVKALTDELLESTGKPLSENRVKQFGEWHATHFKADIANRAAADAADKAQVWIMAGAAGAAFLTFLLIIFISLFVKIERNLRVVRMTVVEDESHVRSDA